MKNNKNRCADCAHNLDKSSLDCEFYCSGATRTKKDNEGTVYITACEDYEPTPPEHSA